MEPKELKKFLDSLKGTDIEELSFESGESKIYFRRNESAFTNSQASVLTEPKKGNGKKEKSMVAIKSPMVGTFYHSDSNDRPPFVIEGNHVSPGQKIGIIEAMKVMKNVTSNVKGKIVKVLVKDGQPVEFGQELFLTDPADVK
ncbi:MAG: biotin/lipoyl-binding protein [Endomicrobiales bacterium]|nr:biotin/lipoyl-binding protein [Endomicrobiales bacterium]